HGPGGLAARVEDEVPDRFTQLLDHLVLGLRLREGVSLDHFAERFGVGLLETLGDTGKWLLAEEVLTLHGGRLRVAPDRQLITNEVLVKIGQELAAYVRRETSASQIAVR